MKLNAERILIKACKDGHSVIVDILLKNGVKVESNLAVKSILQELTYKELINSREDLKERFSFQKQLLVSKFVSLGLPNSEISY